jgi:hypothetical protein
MSTKTTFKRVALVAVAALGLGVLSVAPSSAAPQADTLALASATASTTVGTAVTVNATVSFLQETSSDTMTVSLTYDQAPAGITVGEVTINSPATAATTDLGTPTVDTTTVRVAKVSAATAASINKTLVITLTPTKAGTYVIKATPTLSSGTAVSTAKTWTVTVAAAVVAPISATYSFIAMDTDACSQPSGEWKFGNGDCVGTNSPGIYSRATDTVTTTATIPNTNVKAGGALIASFKLTQSNGATNTMATTIPWTVAITSGPGNIQMGYEGRLRTAKSVTEGTTTSGSDGYAAMFGGYQGAQADLPVYFVSDGTTGATVITFTAGGVLIGTRTITVYGPATALVATAATAPTLYSVTAGQTSNTGTYTVTAKDVNAAAATVPSGLTVKSSDTSVATVTISSPTVTVTGVKAGTATITVTDPATSGAATAASFVVTVAATKPTTVDITFGAASYSVGELVTMTVSANMGDSATAQLFSSTGIVFSATAVASGTAVPTNGVHAIVGGKATYTFYAPAVAGSLVVTATTGAAVDVTTAVVISKTVAIANPGVDAATDAANEAYDAANAATDAALAAAEAADAATVAAQEASDAVAALSESVTKLIAGLQAQIKSLAAVVAKIAKKVKA